MKQLLFRFLLWVTIPIRFCVRYEIKKERHRLSQDISYLLQQRSLQSSVDYVQKHMSSIDSVSSNYELLTIALKLANLDSNKLILEFGVFQGNTINHLASLTTNKIYGFDSFEGLPERWRDGFGKSHFSIDTLPSVKPNVSLIKGWFDVTLPKFTAENDMPVSFLHIDCDLYSSTKTIFDVLRDRILPGCIIVFDEYFNYPGWESGEYKAFQEFIAETKLSYEYIGYNRLHEQVAVKITAFKTNPDRTL